MTIEAQLLKVDEAEAEFAAENPGFDPLTQLIAFNVLRVLAKDVARADDPDTPEDETVSTFDLTSFKVVAVGSDRTFVIARCNILTADGDRRTYSMSLTPESLSE